MQAAGARRATPARRAGREFGPRMAGSRKGWDDFASRSRPQPSRPSRLSPLRGADTGTVVPDTRAFLEEVRQNLQSDELAARPVHVHGDLQGIAAGLERRRQEDQDRGLRGLSRRSSPGKIYRRLVSRDGGSLFRRPSSPSRTASRRRRPSAGSSGSLRRRKRPRQTHEDERRRKERAVVDEVFRMDDIDRRRPRDRRRPARRSSCRSRLAPATSRSPRAARSIQKLAGRAWIDEADRQLVRLEAKLVDSMGVGPAKLARLQKGATAFFQRRKINDEIWLPAEARFTGAARALLLFGGAPRRPLHLRRLQEVLGRRPKRTSTPRSRCRDAASPHRPYGRSREIRLRRELRQRADSREVRAPRRTSRAESPAAPRARRRSAGRPGDCAAPASHSSDQRVLRQTRRSRTCASCSSAAAERDGLRRPRRRRTPAPWARSAGPRSSLPESPSIEEVP